MEEAKKLTIFTPTYNRSDLIVNCYNSLKKQTNNNFKWLIIDDGSTDDTESQIIKMIEEENEFKIEYHKKSNGGLSSVYNYAIEIIDTEFFMCIDSDDYLPDDSVEKIINTFEKRDSCFTSGLIGYNMKCSGEIIGCFPKLDTIHLSTLITKYKFKGDFKAVYKSTIAKQYLPIPSFEEEKDLNPIYLMLKIDKDYKMIVLRDVIGIVDYQSDGMSSNIFQQYIRSPYSFAELRKLYISLDESNFLFKLRHSIHYVSSSILSKKIFTFYKSFPLKHYFIIAFLPGIIFTKYILYKNKKNSRKV